MQFHPELNAIAMLTTFGTDDTRDGTYISLKNVHRALENMNPLPNGKGKIYLEPLNMIEAGADRTPEQIEDPTTDEEKEEAARAIRRLRLIKGA